MYNLTNGDSKWRDRTEGILHGSSVFATEINVHILVEHCDTPGTPGPGKPSICTLDERAYKGIHSRCLGGTTVIAPFTTELIHAELNNSAIAAAAKCNDDGTVCASNWHSPDEDMSPDRGVGELISALEIIQANLAAIAAPLKTGQASSDGNGYGGEPQSNGTESIGNGTGNGTGNGSVSPIMTGSGPSTSPNNLVLAMIMALVFVAKIV